MPANASVGKQPALLPPLPLPEERWRVIFKALGLSPRQTEITRLMLRSASNQQIAQLLNVSEGTVKTQLQRIFSRVGVHDRMEFAMRVLALSHEPAGGSPRRSTG